MRDKEEAAGRPAGLTVYGVGGDYTGARRAQRSFRYCVLAVLAITAACWYLDVYRRYDLVETQYIRALTLEDDSQRAMLRNVVRRDLERNETATPRYLEALAAIEEEDLVLPRYEDAYQLDPKNQSLIINYGCRLYLDTQYRRARDLYREASLIQPPRNALPRYLEAAALLAGDSGDAALREAMALVSRANNSGHPLLFPQPLWHESLPEGGRWHAEKQRDVADKIFAPLYRFKILLLSQARAAIEAREFGEWETWLRELETLGGRLAGAGGDDLSQRTTRQSWAGVLFKRDALAVRMALHRARGDIAGTEALRALEEDGVVERLEAAWEVLRAFEEERERAVAAHEKRIAAPLERAGTAFVLLAALWLASMLACHTGGTARAAWAIPQHGAAKFTLLAGAVLLFTLLALMSLTRESWAVWTAKIMPAWNISLIALALWGLLYPLFTLPLPRTALGGDGQDAAVLSEARRRYRDAVLVLTRRYYAAFLGAFLIVLCAWFAGHRLAFNHYPTDKKLLTTGMRAEAMPVLSNVRDLLQ